MESYVQQILRSCKKCKKIIINSYCTNKNFIPSLYVGNVMTSFQISIPRRIRKDVVKTYADLDTPREISSGNQPRGLFILRVTDSSSLTTPRRWEIMVEGGYAYVGIGAKYYILENVPTINVTSVTATVPGFQYDLVDAFANTYHLIFNGQRGFAPTIERTAGAALVGPVEVRCLWFDYLD